MRKTVKRKPKPFGIRKAKNVMMEGGRVTATGRNGSTYSTRRTRNGFINVFVRGMDNRWRKDSDLTTFTRMNKATKFVVAN